MSARPAYLLLALSAALALAPASHAQTTKAKAKAGEPERTSGVIAKVEADAPGKLRRLTIKTDAIWADWARDQASKGAGGSLAKAAAKGEQGIAAEGEPSSPDDRTVVEVAADAKLEVRYRSPTDETNSGSATPAEAAERAEADPAVAKPPTAGTPKPVKPEELKPGLFVEVEYAKVDGKNRVKRLIVVRPVGGAQSSPKQEAVGTPRN